MRVVAFFVPITKKKTMIYLRYYIKATGIRSIDLLISKLGMQLNKVVLHQDKYVVETQDKEIIKDRFVQGDLPIIESRKKLYRDKKTHGIFVRQIEVEKYSCEGCNGKLKNKLKGSSIASSSYGTPCISIAIKNVFLFQLIYETFTFIS